MTSHHAILLESIKCSGFKVKEVGEETLYWCRVLNNHYKKNIIYGTNGYFEFCKR